VRAGCDGRDAERVVVDAAIAGADFGPFVLARALNFSLLRVDHASSLKTTWPL
jgi:hypothetical protein